MIEIIQAESSSCAESATRAHHVKPNVSDANSHVAKCFKDFELPPHVINVKGTTTRRVPPPFVIIILGLAISVWVAVGSLPALIFLTICGVHLVYTHLWALATVLAVCDRTGGSFNWMGVLTAMGMAITVPWYVLLICRHKDDIVGRVINGWGRWISEDICGCAWPYGDDKRLQRFPQSIRLCYHLIDLAVHFLPTPWLLSQYEVTRLDCIYAFALSRCWSVSASAHHLTLDWRLSRNWPPKVFARSQTITPFVVDGVVNDIYGLRPALPSSSLHFLYSIEAITLLVIMIAGVPNQAILPPTDQLEGAMKTCLVAGAMCGLVGFVPLIISIRKAQA